LRSGDSLIMGKPGVMLSLASQFGANTLSTTLAIEQAMANLGPALKAQGITVYPALHRPANFIERALGDLEHSLAIAAVLILAVLYLFLRDVRAALIAFTAIPLSLLAAVLVLFLVFLNTFAGVREVDQDLIDGARLMRATRAQVIIKVIIPSAMSWVFTGLKISVPYALIGAVLGEMIAANRGLGYLVQFSGSQFDSAGVFAVLFVIALLAVGLNFLVEIVQHRMERWRIVGR